MSRLSEARSFCAAAHLNPNATGKSVRKLPGGLSEPYSDHPIRVSECVASFGASEDVQISALLHDVLEDTLTPSDVVLGAFGANVLTLVRSLTDEFTAQAHPEMNRKARKSAENARLAGKSDETHLIKLADLADNLRDTDASKGFGGVFAAESLEMLKILRGPPALLMRVEVAARTLQFAHDAAEAAKKAARAAKVAAVKG